MELDRYELYISKQTDLCTIIEFISIGPKGQIKKQVSFEVDDYETFNVSLSDVISDNGETSFHVVSDNKDTEKVLNTVAYAVMMFTDQYPKFWIRAEGLNPVRVRLYRMGINKNWHIIKPHFKIKGLTKRNRYVTYQKDGKYIGFMGRRKIL